MKTKFNRPDTMTKGLIKDLLNSLGSYMNLEYKDDIFLEYNILHYK